MLDGTFETVIKTPVGDQLATLSIRVDGAVFTGTVASPSSPGGSMAIDGTVEGKTLRWTMRVPTPFPMTLDSEASVDGDTLTGSVRAGVFGSFPMTGTRVD